MRQHIDIGLRVETSLFSHTAMGIDRSEFNAATVRGALRYWFRAYMGRYIELKDLPKVEAQFFGDRSSSPLKLALHPTGSVKEFLNDSESLLPHKTPKTSPDGKPLKIASLKPGMAFSFEATFTSQESASILLGASWLAFSLGAFGKRARRGAGCVRMTSVRANIDFDSAYAPFEGEDLDSLSVYLARGVEATRKSFQKFALDTRLSSGEIVSVDDVPTYSRVKIGETELPAVVLRALNATSESEARAEVMLELRKEKSPVFGYPYRLAEAWAPMPPGVKRVPSPLWIRLWQLGERWCAAYTLISPLPPCPDSEKEALVRFYGILNESEHRSISFDGEQVHA